MSRLLAVLCVIVGFNGVQSKYVLTETLNEANFFDQFNFVTYDDPTHGYVNFVDQKTASINNYTSILNKNQIYMGVDHVNIASGRGRNAVRLESKRTYTKGLFILDLDHMPRGCGVWPAFWTCGANWPNNGEIDVIENVHDATVNQQTLHTGAGCSESSESSSMFTGTWANTNCNVYETGNSGCGIVGTKDSYGGAFNNHHGGVYAMEWTDGHIQVFYFASGDVPSNLYSSNPDPATWGKPVGYWALGSNCAPSHFNAHQIIFDTTFCGDWAGATFSSACPQYASQSCQNFVQYNPSYFQDAYWLINSLKIYTQDSTPSSTCTSQDNDPYVTGNYVACCDGLESILKDWDNNGNWYYRCEPTTTTCTSENSDPYATGNYVACCDGLVSTLKDWDNNGNWYYRCVASTPTPPTPTPTCTSENNDPYATGNFVACCSGLESTLKDWDNNGNWYYRCVSSAPSNCTPENNDPWATGTNVACCSGLQSCLNDWKNNGNWYYLCKTSC